MNHIDDLTSRGADARQSSVPRGAFPACALGAALAVGALSCPVNAGEYLVGSDAELQAAVNSANADGDPDAVIRLTADIAASALPSLVKPMTIDTGVFSLTTVDMLNTGSQLLTLTGTFNGVSADPAGTGAGVRALIMRSSVPAGSSVVENNGSITGGANGILSGSGGGVGVELYGATFVNNGTIAGGASLGSGHGGIGGSIRGGSTLINNGLVTGGDSAAGQGGAAIDYGHPLVAASLTNNGVIRGGAGATGGGIAILARSGFGPIANTGLIEGGAGQGAIVSNSSTANIFITNSGTIRAGAGSDAIYRTLAATTGSLALELHAGSVIEGNVVAGDAVTTDVFRLGGDGNDTFDISTIGDGEQYRYFDTFEKTGASTWALIGQGVATTNWSILEGTLQIEAGGIIDGTVDISSGARLQGAGEVGATVSRGIISPGTSIGTLMINGNYEGNDGVLYIEAVLAGTGSPADRLLINGDAAGMTTVHVVNVGGAGAPTGTGSTDGISVVQVAGASTADAFQLAGGYAAAGPYQYRLYAFDTASSASSEMDGRLAAEGASSFWDYRLQSAADGNGNPIPVPQVGGYQALPSGALHFGWTILDTLHKRLGEIRSRPGAQRGAPDAEVFLRSSGMRSDFEGDRGPDYKQSTWFTQAGGNIIGWDVDDNGGTLRGGLAISYGESRVDVKSSSAEVDLEGVSAALTGTYLSAAGWSVDGVVIGTHYDADVTTGERGQTGNPDGWGAGFSVEGGYLVDLHNGITVEPQMQLVYQRVWFEDFTDVDDIFVEMQINDSLRWRVGARAQTSLASESAGKQSLCTLYTQIDIINELLDGDGIKAGGVGFGTDVGGASVRLSAGVDARIADDWSFYANVGSEAGIGDGSADSFSGGIGVRMSL